MYAIKIAKNKQMTRKIATTKERIVQFIEHKAISKNKFYAATSIKRGVFDKNNLKQSISDVFLANIIATFPELSLYWLLTGEGEMLVTNQSESIGHSEENNDPKYLKFQLHTLEDKLKDKEDLISSHLTTIKAKQQLIDKLNDQIKSLGGDTQESA